MDETNTSRDKIKLPRDLGQAIRVRRKALGFTQDDLAAQVCVSRATVGAVENGKDTAQVGICLQLCADLGLLLTIVDEDPSG